MPIAATLTAARRSEQSRPPAHHSASKSAACASRERRCRRRNAEPLPLDRARPGGCTPCTRSRSLRRLRRCCLVLRAVRSRISLGATLVQWLDGRRSAVLGEDRLHMSCTVGTPPARRRRRRIEFEPCPAVSLGIGAALFADRASTFDHPRAPRCFAEPRGGACALSGGSVPTPSSMAPA